jgi:hypothetical protein
VPFGGLQPALVRQKRRRLGEKEAKGAQGGIVDGVSGVGTRFAMVWQLLEPPVQDALEEVEVYRGCHDNLLGVIEIVHLNHVEDN